MKQSNKIKTPLIFRVGVLFLCALLLSSQMMGGLYASYSVSAAGSNTVSVARISYLINEGSSVHSITNTAALANDEAVIAVEETFTIVNNGEVAYDYTISLSLSDGDSSAIEGYSLGAPAQNVFMLSSSEKNDLQDYTENAFFFSKNDSESFSASDTPTLSGTLRVGESDAYTVLYFIDLRLNSETGLPSGVSLGKTVTLNYAVTCTQID